MYIRAYHDNGDPAGQSVKGVTLDSQGYINSLALKNDVDGKHYKVSLTVVNDEMVATVDPTAVD